MKFDDLEHRWSAVRPFGVVASTAIVAGGLVAAVTRPLEWGQGSWLAAYLVLVSGVVQVSLGYGQARLARLVPETRIVIVELALFNMGSALVIAGSLLAAPAATTVGGLILGIGLIALLIGVRDPHEHAPKWLLFVYRALIIVVVGSIPVGLAMSWSRHG